jgi:hypothetical protein
MKHIPSYEFERDVRLTKVADFIESGVVPFDIHNTSCCFYGQTCKALGRRPLQDVSHTVHLAEMLMISTQQANGLYGGFKTYTSAGKAVRKLRSMSTAGVRKVLA